MIAMPEVVPLSVAASPRSAVAVTQGTVGLHAGISYKPADETCSVLHLAWHSILTATQKIDAWAYVVPSLDAMEQQILAGMCHLVATTRPRVPYGFQYAGSRFDEDGRFIPGPNERGLTCATFVMAIFELARIPLIAVNTWRLDSMNAARLEEDRRTQEQLVELLRQTRNATQEHADAVEKEVGCMRFRSEEVAAASGLANRPVTFDIAEREGKNVLTSAVSLAGRASGT